MTHHIGSNSDEDDGEWIVTAVYITRALAYEKRDKHRRAGQIARVEPDHTRVLDVYRVSILAHH